MSETVNIPATLDGAAGSIAVLDRVIGAKRWEKAAIIYAFTHNDGRGRPVKENVQKCTFGIAEFSSKTGLHRDTVTKYRRIWEEYGDTSIKPGDTITLPDAEWPKQEGGRTTGSAENAESALASALGNDAQREAAAKKVIDRIASTDRHLLRDALRAAGPAAIVAADEAVKDYAAAGTAREQARQATKEPNHIEAYAEIANRTRLALLELRELQAYIKATTLDEACEVLLNERVGQLEMMVASLRITPGGLSQDAIDAWLEGVTE